MGALVLATGGVCSRALTRCSECCAGPIDGPKQDSSGLLALAWWSKVDWSWLVVVWSARANPVLSQRSNPPLLMLLTRAGGKRSKQFAIIYIAFICIAFDYDCARVFNCSQSGPSRRTVG